jgi:hypothetical protein
MTKALNYVVAQDFSQSHTNPIAIALLAIAYKLTNSTQP